MINPLGRPTIDEDGERMRNRQIRMTNRLWAECLSWGGSEMVREAVVREIARRKAAQKRRVKRAKE